MVPLFGMSKVGSGAGKFTSPTAGCSQPGCRGTSSVVSRIPAAAARSNFHPTLCRCSVVCPAPSPALESEKSKPRRAPPISQRCTVAASVIVGV